MRRSRVRRLRWRRRRRLRSLLRWVRPAVAREAGGEWAVPEWVGVAAGGCVWERLWDSVVGAEGACSGGGGGGGSSGGAVASKVGGW